jgi:hypothetical protein
MPIEPARCAFGCDAIKHSLSKPAQQPSHVVHQADPCTILYTQQVILYSTQHVVGKPCPCCCRVVLSCACADAQVQCFLDTDIARSAQLQKSYLPHKRSHGNLFGMQGHRLSPAATDLNVTLLK